MSGIGIGSVGQSYNQFNPTRPTSRWATGKKINSAADDAAGLAIAKKLENQATGSATAANNSRDMKNLLSVSDGAMQSITDGIGRIRELGLQSLNGIYSKSDKSIFQQEINGIIENINDIGKNTNYNGKSILDGSFTTQLAVIGGNGQSMDVSLGSMLADALGIAGFDVTEDGFDFETLDGALDKALSQLAQNGAQSNRLDYAINAQENQSVIQESARSRKEDADIAESMGEYTHKKMTDQVGITMQKLKMEGMGNFLNLLG